MYVYILPNTLAKFYTNLCNSENRDTGKEAQRLIKHPWLKYYAKKCRNYVKVKNIKGKLVPVVT
jgi:hypothetical protein